MIQIEDVYTAITDGQGWVTVLYLVERLEFRGIHVNRGAIRQLWLEQLEPDEKPCGLAPVVAPGENVIDTREPQCNAGEGLPIEDCPAHGESARQLKTTRQALRDSEDGV